MAGVVELDCADRSLTGPIDAFLKRPLVWAIALAALFSVQTALVLTHWPWLDEWQALQIAVQSPDFAALLDNLRYEGHPPLWYLMLRAAAAVVPIMWVLAAVQLPIALGIQAIIQFRLPFSRLQRLLIGSSAFVLLDYGALSRSLSLGVLLLLLAFAFRRYRLSWIAIALLPMADFLFGVLSLAVLAILVVEKRWYWPGAALWLVVSLLAAWTVSPAPDMIPALWLNDPVTDLATYVARLSQLLLPIPMEGRAIMWNSLPSSGWTLPAGALFIALVWLWSRPIRLHLLLMMGFVVVTAGFSTLVYPLPIRHLSLIAMLLILLVGRGTEQGKRAPPLFTAWLALIAAAGGLIAGVSFLKPFDTASRAVAFIRANKLEDKHWAVFPDSRAQGIAAMTGMEFERLERDCTQSFVRWNYRSGIETKQALATELRRIALRQGRYYLVSDLKLPLPLVKSIATIPAGFDGQPYNLYVVAPDLPENARRPPQCTPHRLRMPAWR